MALKDNNNRLQPSCNRLAEIGEQYRQNLFTRNVYQDADGNRYTASHPNATQQPGGADDRTNIKGKGSNGEYLDTSDGGGSLDVRARQEALRLNIYTRDNQYDCFRF